LNLCNYSEHLKEVDSIENIVYSGYRKDGDILKGLWELIRTIRGLHSSNSPPALTSSF